MISGASIDRCVRILLTTFYHMHHYTVQLLGRWSRVHNIINAKYSKIRCGGYKRKLKEGCHSLLEFSLRWCLILMTIIWKIHLKRRQVQCRIHSDIHHMLHIIHVYLLLMMTGHRKDKVPMWPTWDIIIIDLP